MTGNRFDAGGTSIWDFSTNFLVICPNCTKMAQVISDWKIENEPAKFSCLHCGRTKELYINKSTYMFTPSLGAPEKGTVCIGAPFDWYFHYPLWLQQLCCGHVLWAQNKEHLEWMKQYISAKIRIQKKDELLGYNNHSLAARLPKWIQSASNRPKLLKAIEKLEATLK